MQVNQTTKNYILAGNYVLLDHLIEERERLLEACKKALTCQASMNSDVVTVIKQTIKRVETP